MMRIQNIIRASVVMITLLFLSCVKSEDSFQNATVKLRLEGGIGVTIPDAAADTRAEAIQPTVETLRVLTFNSSGALMGNVLLRGSELTIAADAENYWIITIPSGKFIEASYGDNHVYVVLNESVAGITDELEAETLTQPDMETIRGGKVAYNKLIPVTEGSEPPFIMCVYDVVNVSQSQATLNLTGLSDQDDEPIYGFPMRRTMAKIVLESVYGGVGADGKIIGTDITYNPSSTTDQTGTEDICSVDNNGVISGQTKNHIALAETSKIFVTKVELVNVPNTYSWIQDKNNSQDNITSESDFLGPQDLTGGFTPTASYLERFWTGSITANGTVDFSRTDRMPSIWRQEGGSGSNSYGTEEAYPFTAKTDEDNYSPNGPFVLNSGNFVPWVKEVYGKGEYEEGEIVPENLQLTARINPAAWALNGSAAYYIPENIQKEDNTKQTILRVQFSIGTIMAQISEEEVQNIINGALGSDRVPIVGDGGETLIINKNDNWQAAGIKYVTSQGKYVANTSTLRDGILPSGTTTDILKDQEYGICYEGLKSIWHGYGIMITERAGTFYVDKNNIAKLVTIEIPLNNEKADDHNIYRGHEYRVKLYVTKSSDAWQSANSNRSITYHQLPTMTRSGAEDLCIAAEVVTSTSAN